MDSKYLQGHVSPQDPEGIIGHLYRIQGSYGQTEWLFIDEGGNGGYQYWYFDHNKRLRDGGSFECDSTLTEDILHEACEWADIPDAAVLELEDSDLTIDDLAPEFTGF